LAFNLFDMKKDIINNIVKASLLTTTLLLSSCGDVLNIEPTHLLTTTNAFQNLDDVEQHLNGAYQQFQGGGYYGNSYGVLADMMAEDLYETSESLGNFRANVDWLYVANDGLVSGAWISPYGLINDVNLLIVNVDRFKEDVPNRKNRILGQAYAMRALAHFDLLRYFGQSYDRNSTALGIPIKLKSEVTNPTRNTVKEVYDQIYADLAKARTQLGSVDKAINTATNRRKLDQIGVDAIQARVALYAKDYQTAITSATNAINSPLDLATSAGFPTIWSQDAVANEVIWSIAYLPGEGRPGGNVFFSVNNRLSFRPAPELISLYNTSTDIRYSSYFSKTLNFSSGPNRTGIDVPIKYLGRSPATDGVIDFKVFRIAEMYLIRAEARAVSGSDGGDAGAMADLNALRASRITGYVNQNLTGSQLKDAIAIERRKELFIEGHRWFDIRRAGLGINRGAGFGAPATRASLSAGNFRFVWPIPQDEIIANTAMATQQNPGYN
jgi:starch-binding outer membrane protein, SusD/RagB family